MMIGKTRWMFLAALVALLIPGLAGAQGVVSIVDKPRPDYDPLGIYAGAFTIKPRLTLGTEYNSNIYANDQNKKSDWIIVASPEVDARSDWSRHFLGLNAALKGGFYTSESDENYVDGRFLVDGRLDLLRESFFRFGAGFEYLHEERGSPEDVEAWNEPATYYRTTGNLSYHQGLNRLSLTAGGGVTMLDWRSVELREGGSQSLDIRDRNLYNVNARVAYELLPEVQPFITARYEWRRYDMSEALRDSNGYRIGAGTGFALTAVISGEIFGGYMVQDYDDREKISGPWYGMSLLWNPTQLTSVEATAQSSIKETFRAAATGIDAVEAGIKVDHELLRNLLVGAFADYARYDYEGEDLTDKYYIFGPYVTYLWNRNLSATAEFTRRTRDSNDFEREFSENRFLFTITGHF
jgi:hypothetical protein